MSHGLTSLVFGKHTVAEASPPAVWLFVASITSSVCRCGFPPLLTLSSGHHCFLFISWPPPCCYFSSYLFPTLPISIILFFPLSCSWSGMDGDAEWKRRIKDTCRRNGWARQGREREKKKEGRIDGEISSRNYSIEAAQLELQRHTSEKGKHAEALEIREEGEEDITSLKLEIKVGGFAHFPDFHLS